MDLRRRYEEEVRDLGRLVDELTQAGMDRETIARLALATRYKDLTAEPLRSRILQRTVETYGNPAGPSIDFLRARGKSWDDIIDGATRPGRVSF
ncbi:hypothetical protein [Roseococcus pinisoli]|uniref:Regulatory protein RecX n=1 Tax=Roseococcus pinisoli TaxID=2835040 RepID=A0ABS5QIZ5_9PROT|nr:hypothetical protein [Roseococcus pinisoli]MBS7812508.1 hypothetical protein [Roseococcus pinisoli]